MSFRQVLRNLFQRLKPLAVRVVRVKSAPLPVEDPVWRDQISLTLGDLTVVVERSSRLPVPHEVSVVIPRVEIRRSIKKAGEAEASSEVLLNSITVVHSPQRPPAGEVGQPINIRYQ